VFGDSLPGQTLQPVSYAVSVTVWWFDFETGWWFTDYASGYASASPAPPPPIPTGELTLENGFAWDFTVYSWIGQLLGGSFGGRRVDERDPGGGGPDTCHYPGSPIEEFTAITGFLAPPTVVPDNKWYFDDVGWSGSAVEHYRNAGFAPCDTTFPQLMVIDCSDPRCSDSWVPYATNILRAGITDTTVWSERGGQHAERIWP
jgi:hypothetical protein